MPAIKTITPTHIKALNKAWELLSDNSSERRHDALQAKYHRLKERISSADKITDAAVADWVSNEELNDRLILPNVTRISARVAKLFGKSDCWKLTLGVTTMTGDIAKGLAPLASSSRRYRSRELSFPRLTTLSEDFFNAFSKMKNGGIALDGIKALSLESEKRLARFKSDGLELSSVTSVTPDGFKMFRGHLSLGFEEIPKDVARAMLTWKARSIRFVRLKRLSPEIARLLAKRGTDISIGQYSDSNDPKPNYLTSLEPGVSAALAKGRYWSLSLYGLTKLSEGDAINLLKTRCSRIDLTSLDFKSLSPKARAAFKAKKSINHHTYFKS